MRTGIFGGSFDPVHFGHIYPVAECRAYLNLDQIIYIPAFQPPHKPKRKLEDPLHRHAMLALALQSIPYARIDNREIISEKPVFTIDSVKQIRAETSDEIFLLIGSDNLAILNTWHKHMELISLCRIMVLVRPGCPFASATEKLPEELASVCEPFGSGIRTFPHDPIDLSSSDIRTRLSEGKPVTGLTPKSVENYIMRYRLYAQT
ncbi:MAG TPA: nicotinate-nucleotide adenylyltransferase [Thermoanaerobaculia bacterium]|nr:nicotinate-nucleotide adenylyltransferase [Thermoanaerobaculia bacterium]HUM29367.1 nicotinate-nucleotide adenylyltransferase [Thermoanaerobaculia bacterium]HXK67613.1 nicotinate-nucleotide adenylyltransferase [Thermoanaerobaculia bacterium]